MFLRFRQDNAVRTIDLNQVTQIHKTEFWGGNDGYTVRVDWLGNYAVVADKLTSEQANELEEKLIDAWTQKRDKFDILEIV